MIKKLLKENLYYYYLNALIYTSITRCTTPVYTRNTRVPTRPFSATLQHLLYLLQLLQYFATLLQLIIMLFHLYYCFYSASSQITLRAKEQPQITQEFSRYIYYLVPPSQMTQQDILFHYYIPILKYRSLRCMGTSPKILGG